MSATTVQCIDCKHFSFRRAGPAMAALGFGCCAVNSKTNGHTFSAVHPKFCGRFTAAAEETAAQRRAWHESRSL